MGFVSKYLYYSLVIALGSFGCGQVISTYSPNRAGIIAAWGIDADQAIIYSVLPLLFAGIGGFFVKALVSITGRRLGVFCVGVTQLITWVAIANTKKSFFWLAFLMRAIQGLCTGFASGICSMYIVEISPIEYRGGYGVLHQLNICLGCVYAFFLGIFFEWIPYQYMSMIFTVIHVVLIWTCPDSKVVEGSTSSGPKESIFQMKFFVPILHSLALVLAQQFSGTNAVFTNMQTIFEKANVQLDPSVSATITGSAQVISTTFATYFVEKFGRKPTFVASAIGQTIAHLFLWANDLWNISNNIPIICLFLYVFFFGVGFGPIPWLLVPELFPDSVRSVAQSTASGINWLSAATVVFVWPYMNKSMGQGWSFFIFGFVCFLSTLYAIFLMPETKTEENSGMGENVEEDEENVPEL